MKMPVAAAVLSLVLIPVFADDTGWRQPGVRVWCVGVTASDSGRGDAEEANLIEQAAGADPVNPKIKDKGCAPVFTDIVIK